MSQIELKRLSTPHALFVSGYCFETVICEMKRFMPFLLDRVLAAGVAIRRQKVTRLEVNVLYARTNHSLVNMAAYALAFNCIFVVSIRHCRSDQVIMHMRAHGMRGREKYGRAQTRAVQHG